VTAPAPLPEPNEAPSVETKRRSKRIYILWSIALTLLISTGLFCWLVVVPVWQVRSVVVISYGQQPASPPGYRTEISSREAIRRLGGTAEARRRLNSYMRLPDWAAPEKHRARSLLEYCDELDAWAKTEDAMDGIQRSLEALLKDKDPKVRQATAEALKKIKSAESAEE
jgi:HEAT repeat